MRFQIWLLLGFCLGGAQQQNIRTREQQIPDVVNSGATTKKEEFQSLSPKRDTQVIKLDLNQNSKSDASSLYSQQKAEQNIVQPTKTQSSVVEKQQKQFKIINSKNIPFYCGKDNQKIDLPVPDPKDRALAVPTLYGFNMYVDSRDAIVSRQIMYSGTWEPHYIALLGYIIKPGYNVLNLGSQSGLEALIMGKIVGPNGKLFIFQPYSFSNSLVTKNIQLNGLSNITTIYKIGASDQKGKAFINIAYGNTGGSEIVEQKRQYGQFGAYSETQEVELQRVDQVIPKDIKLDFALLDVEKLQTKALIGMKGIIERSPNLIIMSQWQFGRNPRANRNETIDLLNFMLSKDYKIYKYNYQQGVCKVGTFVEIPLIEDLLRISFMDVFFFPKGVPLPK